MPENDGEIKAAEGRGGTLTFDQLVIACRNIGFDLTCAECASLFYTGTSSSASHAPACSTDAAPYGTAPWFASAVTEAMKRDFEAHVDGCAECRRSRSPEEVCATGQYWVKALGMKLP